MPVEYIQNFTVEHKPVPRRGILQLAPGQRPSGYGSKISTDYAIRFNGKGRAYRVYAVCYSNVASFYVVVGGKQLFVRGVDLEAGRTFV